MDFESLLSRISGVNVLCVGDLILDVFIYGSVERLSPEAPIPILRKGDMRYALGGVGNVAANIASLGGHCHLVALVGKDDGCKAVQDILLDKPDITPMLVFCDDRPTTEKQRYISNRQQMLRVDSESSLAIDGDIRERILENVLYGLDRVDAMVLSDYGKGGLPSDLLRELIDMAKFKGLSVFIDPKGRDFSIYGGADYLTPNRLELSLGTGLECDSDSEVLLAARGLMMDCGIGNILVTRSEQGMSLVGVDEVFHVSSDVVEVYDVAGAGDTVLAAFSLSCASGISAEDSAIFANMAAGVVVGKSEVVTVTPDEILARVSERDFRLNRLISGSAFKVKGMAEGVLLVEEWRRSGLRVVFTNGCFDIVHAGHLSLLGQASGEGDKLVVGINSDASVRRLKGGSRPVQSDIRRAEFLSYLDCVDMVIIFDSDTPLDLIELLCPDVLVKGGDYVVGDVVGGDFVRQRGGRVFIADFQDGLSSTEIIERMSSE